MQVDLTLGELYTLKIALRKVDYCDLTLKQEHSAVNHKIQSAIHEAQYKEEERRRNNLKLDK